MKAPPVIRGPARQKMETVAATKTLATKTLGPIQLAPGVQPRHVLAKLFVAFVAIAMLSGVSLLNAYLLTEHLHLPRGQQGAVTGDLSLSGSSHRAATLTFRQSPGPAESREDAFSPALQV